VALEGKKCVENEGKARGLNTNWGPTGRHCRLGNAAGEWAAVWAGWLEVGGRITWVNQWPTGSTCQSYSIS